MRCIHLILRPQPGLNIARVMSFTAPGSKSEAYAALNCHVPSVCFRLERFFTLDFMTLTSLTSLLIRTLFLLDQSPTFMTQEAPTQNIGSLGFRGSTTKFGGHKHSIHNTRSLVCLPHATPHSLLGYCTSPNPAPLWTPTLISPAGRILG